MRYQLKILVLAFISTLTLSANASTWKYLNGAYSNESIFYFDADSMVKANNSVTVWVKYVKKYNSPDKDGAFSVASKVTYYCSSKQYKVLTTASYDKAKNYLSSANIPTSLWDVVPDTINDLIIKDVCLSTFPQSMAPVINNDIYKATSDYFDYLDAAKYDSAPR